MVLSRGFVTPYSTSSQMANRRAPFVRIYNVSETKNWIQHVANRWWSTRSIVGSLLELKQAINKHEEEDNLEPMLEAVEWAVRAMILAIPEQFMHTQALQEKGAMQEKGAKFVTGSLVVPSIYNLRNSLDVAIDLHGGVA